MNQQPLAGEFGRFPQMKDGDTFLTGRGKAEILLAPGVFLRLGERTLIRLLSDKIMDAKVELLSGGAVVETASLKKAETVALDFLGASITIAQRGVYHLETDPPRLRVFKGKAIVLSGDRRVEVTKGREVLLDSALAAREFDCSKGDALDLWSDRRSRSMAVENTLEMQKASPPSEDEAISAADSDPGVRTQGPRRRATRPVP